MQPDAQNIAKSVQHHSASSFTSVSTKKSCVVWWPLAQALASERPDGSGSSSAGAAASKVQAPGEEEPQRLADHRTSDQFIQCGHRNVRLTAWLPRHVFWMTRVTIAFKGVFRRVLHCKSWQEKVPHSRVGEQASEASDPAARSRAILCRLPCQPTCWQEASRSQHAAGSSEHFKTCSASSCTSAQKS